ncbi:hypothetical protein DFP93_101246 [Aneurinibacillus soli]|uniref:Uncharacterized protein n=1 Tax=Aneurinibacillus soli TaxID=1500254 RepID=A0A0U4WHU7_9BACL|nr:hypothetical protein [Aneurinibacillus soli]PYE64220.1 hypothetical protein DFP93_101246 [Aneurinibacillus soli]BAU28169.1 hypothetical protein CB4_02343 [Aneurinibacillus soli]
MPHYDTHMMPESKRLKEPYFQERFTELITGYEGSTWKLERVFYKAVYDSSALHDEINANKPDSVPEPQALIDVAVAKHYVFKNENLPKAYFGIVIIGSVCYEYEKLKKEGQLPKNDLDSPETAAFLQMVQEKIESLEPSPTDDPPKVTKFYDASTIYFYTCEHMPSIENEGWSIMPWDNWRYGTVDAVDRRTMNNAAVDIEVWKTQYNENADFVILEPEPYCMQSPIVKSTLRWSEPPLERKYNPSYKIEDTKTNWWYDSEIRLTGFIDNYSMFFSLQADNTPAWEDNVVPKVPLYFGAFEPLKKEGENGEQVDSEPLGDVTVLFAGALPLVGKSKVEQFENIPRYDFDNDDKKYVTPPMFPILKNYARHPGNGLNNCIVRKAKAGGRYEGYYLSLDTVPNEMPPKRAGTYSTEFSREMERGYPRAWQNHMNPAYNYEHTPSRYTDRAHVSKIYIDHPEEGKRGFLRHAIGSVPVGKVATRIRLEKEPCAAVESGNKYDYFKMHVFDGLSPLTVRPGTPYRPVGVGIKDTE